jgi:hypothetical protein
VTVRGKSTSLFAILVLFISSCMSIDTTVKIEPGFVGQKYKNVCVMANYEVPIMQYDTEKSFCDVLKSRTVSAVRGQELFNESRYDFNDDSTFAVLKRNNIEACVIVRRGRIDPSIMFGSMEYQTTKYEVRHSYLYINNAVEFLISVLDIKTGKTPWSATSKTDCSGDFDTQVRKAIKVIAKDIEIRLRRDDVISW